jgi:hypothetical protein
VVLPRPDLGDPATHVFAILIFSTFKGPQYALTPSKTALTTAPTQVIVRCILKLPAHAQQHSLAMRLSGSYFAHLGPDHAEGGATQHNTPQHTARGTPQIPPPRPATSGARCVCSRVCVCAAPLSPSPDRDVRGISSAPDLASGRLRLGPLHTLYTLARPRDNNYKQNTDQKGRRSVGLISAGAHQV